jgi:hypothetical protein
MPPGNFYFIENNKNKKIAFWHEICYTNYKEYYEKIRLGVQKEYLTPFCGRFPSLSIITCCGAPTHAFMTSASPEC